MADTKERILITALRLFAKDGYEAVSVQDIAREVGITKGAMYRHYENKRDLFNSILARMEQNDARCAEKNGMPAETAEETPESYLDVSPEEIVSFSKEMFRYWTKNEFAASFRKMLTLEQFRNAEMEKLYQQYLVSGPVGYLADLFRGMGVPGAEDEAARFYAPMFLLYTIYDAAEDKDAVTRQADRILEELGKRINGGKEQ